MEFYKRALFQLEFENNYYLGIFTYDFFKYSYYKYISEKEDNRKENKIERLNIKLTNYISFFLDSFLEEKKYKVYFISEIGNKKNNDITLDKNVHIECVINQENKFFSFLEYKIEKEDFKKIEKIIENKNEIWDFKDYSDEEKPFTYDVYKKPEKKTKTKIVSKKVHRCHYESDKSESEYESSDQEEHDTFVEDCKKYEQLYPVYSEESRKKYYKDASEKCSFWQDLKYKSKENEELYNYCRIREATQICRMELYEDYNIFRLKHLYVVKYLEIEDESNIDTDFDNNDDLEVSIIVDLESNCGKYKSAGKVCQSGCYENGGFDTTTDIDYIENVDKRALKELYLTIFRRYNPLDI